MSVDINGDACQEVPQLSKTRSSMGLNNLLRCHRSHGFGDRLREGVLKKNEKEKVLATCSE